MDYFKYFPTVEYSTDTATNICVRAKIQDIILNNLAFYYPYVVLEGDRPDTLAFKYYGNANLAWIILYANQIFDPFYDWVLSYDDFERYIISKYGNNTTVKTETHHYENLKGQTIDEETFLSLPSNEREEVSVYDYEYDLNEAKRTIILIDKKFSGKMVQELKAIFR